MGTKNRLHVYKIVHAKTVRSPIVNKLSRVMYLRDFLISPGCFHIRGNIFTST